MWTVVTSGMQGTQQTIARDSAAILHTGVTWLQESGWGRYQYCTWLPDTPGKGEGGGIDDPMWVFLFMYDTISIKV